MNARRTLAAAGLWGALLTVVILAMSVLLRLGTEIGAGEAASTLPAAVERSARIAHRIAAMAVGLIAVVALLVAFRERPVPAQRLGAVGLVVGLTLLLAAIGRHTPGYRVDAVTIANVAGGVALVAAFWWLRSAGQREARRGDGLAWVALAVLFALAAIGAAADAAAMRGERAFGALHLGLGALFVVLALAVAWRARAGRTMAVALAAAAALQLGLGLVLEASGARPLGLAWAHAMLACLLAPLLVSAATGSGDRLDRLR